MEGDMVARFMEQLNVGLVELLQACVFKSQVWQIGQTDHSHVQ